MLDTWQKDRARRPHFDQLVAAFDKMIRKPDTLQAEGGSGDRSEAWGRSPGKPGRVDGKPKGKLSRENKMTCLLLPHLRPSQALLNPVALDFPCLDSPQAWLSAIGLECYQDNFSKFGLSTFSDVAQLSLE